MTTIVTDQFSAEDSDLGELLDFEAAKDSSSWDRADPFEALIKPISGMGYQVKMPDAGGGHTVAIGEQRGRYVGLCTCKGFKFHDKPCCHLCTIRKADFIGATDAYGDPVRIAKIDVQETPPTPDLSVLTRAERNAYVATRLGDVGVREYQRQRGYSSPGTVGNLLARADRKLESQAVENRGDVDRAQRSDAVTGVAQ